MASAELTADRDRLLQIVMERALIQFDEPRELSSGELSRDFIDAKAGLSRGSELALACRVIADSVAAAGIEWDAVGGLTLGADQFAHGVVAVLDDDHRWFVVRKQPKGRGTNRLVEGTSLGPGTRVLLVDDIVTTGGSIRQAHRHVLDTGATVVAAVTLVDRSDVASAYFADHTVPDLPVFTYRDLGILAVGVSS